jgi:hypothetical protein
MRFVIFIPISTQCGCTIPASLAWLAVQRPNFLKRLRSPGIDSKESIPPAYVDWRAGTTILSLFGSKPPLIVQKFQYRVFSSYYCQIVAKTIVQCFKHILHCNFGIAAAYFKGFSQHHIYNKGQNILVLYRGQVIGLRCVYFW